MTIKSFRGLIADGDQTTIVLHTNDGSTGYRIVKFEILPFTPGDVNQDSCVQVWKVSQTLPTVQTIDFSEQTLLGAAMYGSDAGTYSNNDIRAVIFDSEIFNQDIYVTHQNTSGSEPINYYIELEQVKLDLGENTVATLKDIRNITAITG